MEIPNLNYIDALSGGDSSFKATLINVIKDEFPKEVEQYHKHVKIENYLKAAEDVHKLKHKISILGLEKGYEIAIKHEEALKLNKTSLDVQFQNTLTTITQFLTNL